MLSREKLADIVKNKVEDKIRKRDYGGMSYYILLDGSMYRVDDYDIQVIRGTSSAEDIYAYVHIVGGDVDVDAFLFYINFVDFLSLGRIIDLYLRKVGFTITNRHYESPTPNLKYYIDGIFNLIGDNPEYLVIEIYDIDSIARSFRIPQIVEQKLGNKPRVITTHELSDIYKTVVRIQPLLAGYTYGDAHNILYNYYVLHEEKYKNEAHKIDLAYFQLFPSPYRVCYEWKMKMFIGTSCLKVTLRSFSS